MNTTEQALNNLDAAFEEEIQHVTTLEFDSNKICRHFYGELRKRFAALAQPAQETTTFLRERAQLEQEWAVLRQLQEAAKREEAMNDHVMRERDSYHEMADKLASAIAEYFGADIGEHSSANCPWRVALEVIENADAHPQPSVPVNGFAHTVDDDFEHFLTISGLRGEDDETIRKMRLAYENAWEPSVPVAQDKVSYEPEPTIGAKMPDGSTVTNVYEAFEAGKRAAKAERHVLTESELSMVKEWLDTLKSVELAGNSDYALLEKLRTISTAPQVEQVEAKEGWIGVKDRLPECRHECTTSGTDVSDTVLIYGLCVGGFYSPGMGHLQSNGKWVAYEGEHDFMDVRDVTHWMKIPKSPAAPSSQKEGEQQA